MSFEELRAASRGWAGRDWRKLAAPLQGISGNAQRSPLALETVEPQDIENLTESFQQNASIIDTSTQSMVGTTEPKVQKQRRTKMREVKQEAQTVKTRLESPTGPKMRRKGSSEPTMTFNSRAAHNDIYEMFNQPIQKPTREDTQSGDDTDYGDDTYSTAGESTGTGRISAATSDFGDDTLASVATGENTGSQPESVSPWSDFTASKHVPKPTKSISKHKHLLSDDMTENLASSQNLTQTGGIDAGFDTQAIAAIANQDFDDMDTKAIALIAGDVTQGGQAQHGDDEGEQEDLVEEVRYSEELDSQVEPEPEHIEIQNQPRYVPLPPEDYEPTPLRPYRDPELVAQNKLPFMTPIVEQTESSIGASTVYKEDYYDSKTPSRTGRNGTKYDSPSKLGLDELLMSTPPKESPQSIKRRLSAIGVTEEELFTSSPRRKQPPSPETQLEEAKSRDAQAMPPPAQPVFKTPSLPSKPQATIQAPTQGPVIQDLQCNPCDTSIRQQILNTIQPPLSSYDGFTDSSTETLGHHQSLKTFADKLAKQKTPKFSPRKSANDRTLTKAVPPILKFHSTSRVYAVKRELGKGAFAPVYLVDSYDSTSFDSDTPPASPTTNINSSRSTLEALKTESPPHTLVWEFHILRLLRARLAPSSRTLTSLIRAHECHLYRDEAYLILSYSPQGTLLDLVNLVRTEHIRAGKTAVEGVDEPLAVFFGVELLRTMAALHSVGILHGDLKADNCLVRLDDAVDITAPYNRDGKDGWTSKGLTLIDFGRGIDTRMFQPQAKFVADWAAHKEDCVEIREARPWKWQIDFFGAASILHTLLFGRYMETIEVRDAENAGDGIRRGREMKVKEGFKRYWDREMWSDVFGVLLNKGQCDDEVRTAELDSVLRRMERWLEEEGERKALREGVRRCERLVCRKEK